MDTLDTKYGVREP